MVECGSRRRCPVWVGPWIVVPRNASGGPTLQTFFQTRNGCQMSPEEERAEVRGLDPWGLNQVEQLLSGLAGITSLKVVPDGHGGIAEVHVVSDAGVGPKQIVRNIESALLAEFGLQIDHRKISVAEVQQPDIDYSEAEPLGDLEPVEESSTRRLLLETLEIERKARDQVACRVVLRSADETYSGEAEGADFSRSRLEVAGHAVLEALNRASMDDVTLRLEGVQKLNAFGRELVVAVVQGQERRRSITLPGVSLIEDSPEEATVLACLQATNRWAGAS